MLRKGLLLLPQLRELRTPRGRIENIYSFTIPESAKALGKSELTFKRWIADGMVPRPILVDTVRGYSHYSEAELHSIANELIRHEREFSYYAKQHRSTRAAINHRVNETRLTAGFI